MSWADHQRQAKTNMGFDVIEWTMENIIVYLLRTKIKFWFSNEKQQQITNQNVCVAYLVTGFSDGVGRIFSLHFSLGEIHLGVKRNKGFFRLNLSKIYRIFFKLNFKLWKIRS